jgi:hypothetical protein
MPCARVFEADHKRPQFSAFQPERNLALEHTALGVRIGAGTRTFAGDHQHHACAAMLGTAQEMRERGVCIRLRHAVQVDARVDLFRAAHEFLAHPAAKRRERWWNRPVNRFRRGWRDSDARGPQ